jgi:adenylyl- and sulfurtransferase ThiI
VRGLALRGARGQIANPWGRLLVRAPARAARETLAHTFGVVSFSPVREAPAELGALGAAVAEAAGAIPDGASFAVRARRSGEPGYTSMEAARAIGTAVLDAHRARGLRVDLDAPDAEVVVEVREGRAFVGLERVPGPGGLPAGSEGKVAVWLDGPRGALAAWLLAKRGCRAELLVPPGVDPKLLEGHAAWDTAAGVRMLPRKATRDVALAALAFHAAERGCAAVALGEGLAEAVRSAARDRAIALPVFRPLAGLPQALLARYALQAGLALRDPEPFEPGTSQDARAEAEALLRGAPVRRVSA